MKYLSFIRTLLIYTSIIILSACTDNSSKTQYFPTATLDVNTPTQKVIIARLGNDFHEYQELHFTFRSNNYFSQNPKDAHAAVVMRGNASIIDTRIMGVGMVFGDVSRAGNPIPGNPATQPNKLHPSVQIETWFNGLDSSNFLLTGLTDDITPPPILKDNIDYKIIIQSYVTKNKDKQTIRIVVNENNAIIYDTGAVPDPNKYIDTSYNDIGVGHVFYNVDAGPWSIVFSDIILYY